MGQTTSTTSVLARGASESPQQENDPLEFLALLRMGFVATAAAASWLCLWKFLRTSM